VGTSIKILHLIYGRHITTILNKQLNLLKKERPKFFNKIQVDVSNDGLFGRFLGISLNKISYKGSITDYVLGKSKIRDGDEINSIIIFSSQILKVRN